MGVSKNLLKDFEFRLASNRYDNAYIKDSVCPNCGIRRQVHIKKGILISSVDLTCENCEAAKVQVTNLL